MQKIYKHTKKQKQKHEQPRENIRKQTHSSETDNLCKSCLSSQLMWWHQIRLIVNNNNLALYAKGDFPIAFQ